MTEYDPKKTSERRFIADGSDRFLETGAWLVVVKSPDGQWTHYWPDNQKPEGLFLDKNEALEWMRGAVKVARDRGLQGQGAFFTLVEIREILREEV